MEKNYIIAEPRTKQNRRRTRKISIRVAEKKKETVKAAKPVALKEREHFKVYLNRSFVKYSFSHIYVQSVTTLVRVVGPGNERED